ncbi:PREDICTED: ubiquitin carboxyl-terminal hydrolase 28-like isoform X1 [Amphimedon queenslandica]|uniref:USP domain-containing protein n=1 Tax=Amphimedon queenslandica TaxID=400682 RepID=A0A1X7UQI5_AMPQE|nr:PREDICTED: ubiquitin carboxyl-terminal hydrolase 28-like isoform X1 [Amphimedon queenslandica]|eukprot:XP_011404322.2 PREDICTED: ubiquitin carboxyl-terminal hydrolase 28-like isoform X1 [Amphimedon queenslandica]
MTSTKAEVMSDKAKQDIMQLQEIFGITSTEAENSYQYYKNSLSDAVVGLSSLQENGRVSLEEAIAKSPHSSESTSGDTSQGLVATCANNPMAAPAGGGGGMADSDQPTGSTNTNPIDLTQESQDDDLQKALALSLQDMQHQGGGISLEDQELSKALEASIADTHTEYGPVSRFVDPLNPHERKKIEGFPLGLKNIGNTCWFSAVIQSLFNIPAFRDSILHFNFKTSDQTEEDLPHCVLFVLELQKLFALLLESHQRYIDPKQAIDLLNASFQTLGGNHMQQDVSEFKHKLLEWIEDAFNYQDKTKNNPIIELFTGECVTEGKINETSFVNRSQFGAFPVQIEGHAHLHDSLEAATVNTEMEQETWFTHLPPVLVLELSRFKYNQLTGQAEKIHDSLSFDKTLYLDRYLHSNASQTRLLRKEMGLLRQKMRKIEETLKSYTDYNGKKVPINDVLSIVFDFTSSRLEGVLGAEGASPNVQEEGRPSPRSGSKEEVEFVRKWLEQWRSEMDTEISELKSSLSATRESLDAVYSDPSMNRTSYHLHSVLVHQGQASRGHYWAYVRKKKTKKRKATREMGIQASYLDDEQTEEEGVDKSSSEEKREEGEGHEDMEVTTTGGDTDVETFSSPLSSCEPSSGPASVAPPEVKREEGSKEDEEEIWLKYNDVSVTTVDWEEVKRESFGGRGGESACNSNGPGTNTSAYCLLYVNSEAAKTWREEVHLLSLGLQRYIAYHNLAFERELKAYDLKVQLQQLKTSSEGKELIKPAKAVRFEYPKGEEDPGASTNGGHDMMALASDAKRARAGSPSNLEDMQIDLDNLPPVDPALLNQLSMRLSDKLQMFIQDVPGTIIESRLLTDFHYAHACQTSEKVRQAILYEHVIQDLKRENDLNMSLIARKYFVEICKDPQIYQELQDVRLLYSRFCSCCYHFIQSVNEAKRNSWCLSLAHIINCFYLNSSISAQAGDKYSLDQQLLGRFRCKALLMVSEIGTVAFTSGEVSSSIVIGNDYIVPGLKAFSLHPFPGDDSILEKVREEWCQCLDQSSLTEDDSDKLADLLMKIVEDYSKAPNIKIPQAPSNFDTQRLAAQYTTAYKTLTSEILL